MKEDKYTILKPYDTPPTKLLSTPTTNSSTATTNININLNDDDDDDNNDCCSPGFHICIIDNNITDFNKAFEEFTKNKSEDALDILNRCLALLASTINPSTLNMDKPDIAKFFMNVYKLLENIESGRSTLLWSAVAVLDQAVQNTIVRSILVEKFKFMHIISKILESVSKPDRVRNILHLIENITYGISIIWLEPYLNDLIRNLVKFIINSDNTTKILNDNDNKNNILKIPALTALINICYKNLPSIYILNKIISIEKFLNSIQNYGILTYKMNYILNNNKNSEKLSKLEIHKFIKFTFMEIDEVIKNPNSGQLRHIIDFFKDLNTNYYQHFIDYSDYLEKIQNIIKTLSKSPDDDKQCIDDERSHLCVAMLFEFLKDLFDILGYQINEFMPTVVKCLLDWINSETVAIKSLQLLLAIVEKNDTLNYLSVDCKISILIGVMNAILIFQSMEIICEQKIAILKLILELLKQQCFFNEYDETLEYFIMDTILKEYFESDQIKLSSPINDDMTKMFILAINVMKILTEIFPKNFKLQENLNKIFKSPITYFIIGKAMLSGDSDLSTIIFELSKLDIFPANEVSQEMCNQRTLVITKKLKNKEILSLKECCKEYIFMNNLITNTSQPDKSRFDELIEGMFTALHKKEIGNVLMSDIMNVFELKLKMYSGDERDLLERIDECNRQMTNLSHKVTILLAEISHYQTENLHLKMSNERIKSEIIKTDKEKLKLMEKVSSYETLIDQEKTNQNNLIKEINDKNMKFNDINDKLMTMVTKVTDQDNELKNLQLLISEEANKNKNLETRQSNLEELICQLKEQLLEKDKRIVNQTDEIENLTKEKFILEETVDETKRTLEKKETLLTKLVKDLKDVEQMRNEVVTIIQRKKCSESLGF